MVSAFLKLEVCGVALISSLPYQLDRCLNQNNINISQGKIGKLVILLNCTKFVKVFMQ